jgi:hypothetical protein
LDADWTVHALRLGQPRSAFSIPHLNGTFPEFILGWTIGAKRFNAKTPRRNVAKRHNDNSPAIYGWVKRQPNGKVPRGTAERFFRP